MVLDRLRRWFENNLSQQWQAVDFEHEYLFEPTRGGLRQNSFLDADLPNQVRQWRQSWAEFVKDLNAPPLSWKAPNGVFLSLHGLYIRGHYGSRCVLNIDEIVSQFQPTLIVTLIADVYDMWWRTERRAQGEAWRGRPSLEQLVSARRQELIVGDQLAYAKLPSTRNLMLAVGHPCDTLAHCILHQRPRVVYLSFPISEPRKMAVSGDPSGMNEVSEFIRLAYHHQKTSPHLVLECPLAIDEIPFISTLPQLFAQVTEDKQKKQMGQEEPSGLIAFDRDTARWNLESFWPAGERLAIPPEATGSEFPETQLRDASGSILTDVTFRDYRLVDQADCLAVFNPVFNRREQMAGSVGQEIDFAVSQGKPVYLYQDPKHDDKNVIGEYLARLTNSTMAPAPSRNLIIRKNSVQELLDAVTS